MKSGPRVLIGASTDGGTPAGAQTYFMRTLEEKILRAPYEDSTTTSNDLMAEAFTDVQTYLLGENNR